MSLTLVKTVWAGELRRLVRDRRALFFAVILPMLLYPALFLGMEKLEESTERSLEERSVRVVHDLDALEPALAEQLVTAWSADELRMELHPAAEVMADTLRALEQGDGEANIIGQDFDLFVLAEHEPGREQPLIRLWFDRSQTRSGEARERVLSEIEALSDRNVLAGLERLGGDPGALLGVEVEDLAPPEDAGGRALGKLLPLLAVIMLVSGGSFAALDSFAGEREGNTLETLLVQPVPAMVIALGKFGAVLVTACVALFGNATSFLLSLSMGWGSLPGSSSIGSHSVDVTRMGIGLAVFFPTAVLLSAVLCLVAARAHSFREGQHYVLPLMILALAPASLSTIDRVDLGWVLAVVPIAGSTLAFREALSGGLAIGPALLVVAASAGWAWLALSKLAQTLDAERLLQSRDVAGEHSARHTQSRRAIAWGFAAVLLIYLVGGRMQAANIVWGLLATLWILVPVLALLAARGTACRSGESLPRALGLLGGRPRQLLGALLLAPALCWAAKRYLELQERVLPSPQMAIPEGLEALGGPALFFLLALTPGVCEELLFRGALLGGMKKDLDARRCAMWQFLLFGAAHASIYRFIPTGLVGVLLTLIALRTKSIWPGVLLHVTYNGMLVLELSAYLPSWGEPALALLALPGLVLLFYGPAAPGGHERTRAPETGARAEG